jgi:hypothetical protein
MSRNSAGGPQGILRRSEKGNASNEAKTPTDKGKPLNTDYHAACIDHWPKTRKKAREAFSMKPDPMFASALTSHLDLASAIAIRLGA